MEISTRIQQLRIKNKLLPSQVARKIKIPLERYKKFEAGELELGIKDQFQLAEFFSVSPRWLILGDRPRVKAKKVTVKKLLQRSDDFKMAA